MGLQPERHSQHSVSGEPWKLSSFSELLAAGAMGGRTTGEPQSRPQSQNPWFCGQHPPHPSVSHRQLPDTQHSQCALITSSQTWLVRLPYPKPTTRCGKCIFLTSSAVQIREVQFLSKMAPSTLGVGHWEFLCCHSPLHTAVNLLPWSGHLAGQEPWLLLIRERVS